VNLSAFGSTNRFSLTPKELSPTTNTNSMTMHPPPITSDHATLAAKRVEQDDCPSLLLFLNVEGTQISLNRSALLFFATNSLTWDGVFVDSDSRLWQQKIAKSRTEQTPISGCFKLRRFDNAVRTFVLRAEPRYDHVGAFSGHVVSGLDITDVVSDRELPHDAPQQDASPDSVRQIAQKWHDELVSSVTVITISNDLLPDLISRGDSGAIDELLNRISIACASIRANVDSMNAIARNQQSPPDA